MRKKIVAGNWKMNKNLDEAKELIKGLKKEVKKLKLKDDTRVIIAPSFINLRAAVNRTKKSKIEVAAQNVHQEKRGAFTGEVSVDMLESVGVKTAILGHSERRTYFGETDELLAEKVNTVLGKGLEAIFCFGELLEDRKSNSHFKVVEDQIKKALFHLDKTSFTNVVLAYEPVWAIGTGETASPEQAQEMHAFIRNLFVKEYGEDVANSISILYGGSVKPNNAKEIFSKPDVDGGLIGGASLKVDDFTQIIKAI
ncbi:triosephosphate isomerase [Tenacibaculum holothuriorum]|uniref:Triosephosphate isomerase n=1 Tax=Tenacibaculum holothuriorum TaxID=1635173 RepID=A0A1Y2PC87_9FLAO|nr:triose-phosphate isomerase [Tenacibaculum holothuriorum]OSY87288.1 triosephosphate isomerase [Tenacibaculum holothuriorum]